MYTDVNGDVISTNPSNFQSLEVVDRVSEKQI